MRGQCKLAEARRDAKRGTFIPKNKHGRTGGVKIVHSDEHKNLQKFLHPWLDGKKFQTRAQLERHMVSPAYLKSLAEKGVTDANKHYTDLMDLQLDSLAERSAAWTKPPKESSKEYFEISRKIKTYTLPEYDEENPQPIGKPDEIFFRSGSFEKNGFTFRLLIPQDGFRLSLQAYREDIDYQRRAGESLEVPRGL